MYYFQAILVGIAPNKYVKAFASFHLVLDQVFKTEHGGVEVRYVAPGGETVRPSSSANQRIFALIFPIVHI
jgi:hypothetical protein